MFSKFYDDEAAKLALDQEIKDSVSVLRNANDVAMQHLSELKMEDLMIQITGENRKIWRVGPVTPDGKVEDELVFRMQGILSKRNLVPGDIQRFPSSKVANLSQQASIVGAGSELFEAGFRNLKQFHGLFSRHFPSTTVAQWPIEGDGGYPTMNASNRYMTTTQDDPTAMHVPFGPGVDPLGRLQKYVGAEMVHTADNEISYYKKAVDPVTGKSVYDKAFPANFRIGDVVEMQVSVIGFQGKDKNIMKLHCHLRALTLLESKFSKAAEDAQESTIKHSVPVVVNLRRKVGHDEQDIEGTASKKAAPSTSTP
ncbi:hypothetical protein B0H11DRAFT_1931643 [Mycena galericulata]|nr:hypothetical protein B0H11DRAFT_1940803 [Mycena galericulata]KAJ7443516.1 hypothetical protein B0H11DRAFT_1931643 [Mycena galericulata]